MDGERFLVTGALGCIGAWVVRNLVRGGVPTATFDLASDPRRLRLTMAADELARVTMLTGDITDLAAVEAAFGDFGATHIIHLAGLQVPFCKADPALGARVNVVGTVNVFEAAKRRKLRNVVYASSAAVYGISEDYPEGPIGHDAPLRPGTHYGVYKRANEGNARVFWLDHRVASVGLRPLTVYGVGRDQGLTSDPTRALKAAVLRRGFRIRFSGPTRELLDRRDLLRSVFLAGAGESAAAIEGERDAIDRDGAPVLEVVGLGRTFGGVVAVADDRQTPVPVPPVLPLSAEEERLYEGASRRRELRLILAGRLKPKDAEELKLFFSELSDQGEPVKKVEI